MQSQLLYDTYKDGRHWDGHPVAYAEHFADFLEAHSFVGELVVVGCGSGRDVDVFHERGFDAVGIDSDEQEISSAKRTFPLCRFEYQDAEHMSFPDGGVGALFVINVMHYLDEAQAIREFGRVLRPGGYACIHFNLEIRDSLGHVDYAKEEADVRQLVSDFEIVERRHFERTDRIPKLHTHKILELVLRK